MTTTAERQHLPFLSSCPKTMAIGPCGGVSEHGECEIDLTSLCSFLNPDTPSVSAPVAHATRQPVEGALARRFQDQVFAVIGEVNGVDSADAATFVEAAKSLGGVVDIVSITDHSGANVHMGNVAASAHLTAAGVETMTTFSCRDRNRIALQGDLLGVSSLGVRSVLLVTGNHPEVGDSPDAKPVFDLDSTRMIAMAARLRDEGTLLNGRELEAPPSYLVGGTAHPFAPPYADRPDQAMRKVDAGADYLISQHIFDLPRWRDFLKSVNERRPNHPPFSLLGGIAVLPDEVTARRVSAGLRGFTVPESTFERLRHSKDPQSEGIDIAAEILSELANSPGVAGCLVAPVTGRANALAATLEQTDIIAEVINRAGVRDAKVTL